VNILSIQKQAFSLGCATFQLATEFRDDTAVVPLPIVSAQLKTPHRENRRLPDSKA